jgi:hypothetical protein
MMEFSVRTTDTDHVVIRATVYEPLAEPAVAVAHGMGFAGLGAAEAACDGG